MILASFVFFVVCYKYYIIKITWGIDFHALCDWCLSSWSITAHHHCYFPCYSEIAWKKRLGDEEETQQASVTSIIINFIRRRQVSTPQCIWKWCGFAQSSFPWGFTSQVFPHIYVLLKSEQQFKRLPKLLEFKIVLFSSAGQY